MIKNTIKFSALTLAVILTGCGYIKMSSEEAIRYQSVQLINTTKTLFASLSAIPDGDITKIIVAAGGAFVTTPDVYPADSEANKRDADAMFRLNTNSDAGTITNEFGGSVKIVSKNEALTIIYTKVPLKINCAGIANVVCEHS